LITKTKAAEADGNVSRLQHLMVLPMV